jgi:hypothetical protein
MESVGIALFILIPALPVPIALCCLAAPKRWVVMGIMRWALLAFCATGLLLRCYDVRYGQHVVSRFGFDDDLFDVVLIQAASAYVIALLISCLSPWRRPRQKQHDSSV